MGKRYHSVTDVGRERQLNEDDHGQIALDDGGVLLIVCDGMGGHEGGEVASKLAVEAIGQIFQNSPSTDPREKLMNGFRVANQRILSAADKNGTQGMGTTAVAAYVRGDQLTVAHVGDSRVYVVRDGRVLWRTLDHTRVQKMIDRGIIPESEAKSHPDANVVTRALGYRETADGEPIEPEIAEPCVLVNGDHVLLCSDGLYDGLTDDEIAAAAGNPEVATQALVDLANERGGHDNITVTILTVADLPAGQASVQRQAVKKDRVTALDAGPAGARKTAADSAKDLATAKSSTKMPRAQVPTAVPNRRRGIAVVMFLVAAGIAVLVGWKLTRGDDVPADTGKTSGTDPTTKLDGGELFVADDGGVLRGSDEAPPLPENPLVNRPPIKPKAGSGSSAKAGSGSGSATGSGSGSSALITPPTPPTANATGMTGRPAPGPGSAVAPPPKPPVTPPPAVPTTKPVVSPKPAVSSPPARGNVPPKP